MLLSRVDNFLSGGSFSTVSQESNGVWLIHLNVLLYALCFWVQQPVLPFLSKELGASATGFGTLESTVSFMALLGGAMMGRLTDVYGAKWTLIASHGGSLAMYSLMAVATRFEVLLLSRIPALLQHAMLCSQAAVSTLAPKEKRSVAIGRLSLSYACGMVVGSPLGGKIAQVAGYQSAAACAAGVTLIIIIVDVLSMPDYKSSEVKKEEQHAGTALEQVKVFLSVLTEKKVAHLLFFVLPISIGIGAFRSSFAVAAGEIFDLQSSDLGKYISFAAFVGLLTNVFVIGVVNARLGDFNSVVLSSLVQMFCFLIMTQLTSYNELLAVTVLNTMGSTLLYTLSSSLMSLAVSATNTGSAIAVSHGSRSLVGIISPVVGGFVYDAYGFQGLNLFCAAACLVSAIVAFTVSRTTLKNLEASKLSNEKKSQ